MSLYSQKSWFIVADYLIFEECCPVWILSIKFWGLDPFFADYYGKNPSRNIISL